MGASSSTENLGHQLSSDLLLEAIRSAEPLGGRYVTTKLEHGRQVVVKVFKDVQSHDVAAFQRRAAALCGLDMHLHLLLPMGWAVAESSCFVVYDQLDQIDAEKRLQMSRRGGKAFLWADRLRLAAAVASAASHLRSCLLGSPHLNLKLSSVVFDRTGQVKLADLGFEGASFEGKGDLQSKKAQAGSLASQQVAELHDLGRLLFELLLPSSEFAKAAVQAAKQLEALDSVRPAELFQRLGVPGCDASAAWPQAAAHDAAVTALQCVLAEAAGTQPPPGMTNVAGMLLHQCQRSRHVEGASFSGIEVAFDCSFSSQLDVQSLSVERRFWRFPPMGVGHALGPWPVGRQHQVELFVQLVPDRRLCSSIGRTHFELWPLQDAYREGSWFWRTEKQALRLVPLSQNPILVDGKKVAYPSEEEVLIFDGSKVSFSFQDEVFLTLQFLLGPSIEAATARAKSEGAAEPKESPVASYVLQCEELLGESVDDFSKEDRRIQLLAEGANFIGRMSHPGYFDKLQRGAPQGRPFLPFVSRRHLQVTASPYDSSEPPNKQCFEVVNWSNNPISVAGHRLEEGQKRMAQVGDTIELLGEDGRGGVAPYLIFRLLWLGAGRSNLSLASRSTLLPAGAIFKDRFKADGQREPFGARPARPPFQLILAGTAVVKGLPQSWRVVDGLSTGLTVGRAHQRELHEKALVEGVLEYISRDHFSIKASKDGNFSVVPLSQNPMWHSRGGRLQLLQPGHLPVRLQHADVLVLYTGADDATHPDGPGSHGSLQWIFKITTGP